MGSAWRYIGWMVTATVVLLLFLTPSSKASDSCGWPASQPPVPDIGSSPDLTLEAAGRRVSDLAKAKNALGSYWDGSAHQFVVVIPPTGPGSDLTLADFGMLNLPLRVVRSGLTQTMINAIEQRISLRSWHPEAYRYAYGFG